MQLEQGAQAQGRGLLGLGTVSAQGDMCAGVLVNLHMGVCACAVCMLVAAALPVCPSAGCSGWMLVLHKGC